MQEEITSLELLYLTKELQDIIGGRIDKIYQNDREFLLTMHVRSKGRKRLKIIPNAIYLTEYKEEFPETPPGFCKFLRKHLGGSIIRSIEQVGFERILEMKFEGKEKNYIIIVELFSNGNLVVCDEDYKIISALESNRWKDRTVRGGVKYEFPPEQVNTLTLKEKDFNEIIKKSNKDFIVKTLAVDFGLGGLFAEELCLQTKLDKEKKKVTSVEMKNLFSTMQKLFKKKVKANVSEKGIVPFELKQFEKETKQFFETFSEAIDSKFSKKIIKTQKNSAAEKKNKILEKIQVIIDQQEKTIKGMKVSEKENTKKGEHIYEHYEQVKQILEDINKARDKFSWEEIKERLKNHEIIKEINEKEGKVTVELK